MEGLLSTGSTPSSFGGTAIIIFFGALEIQYNFGSSFFFHVTGINYIPTWQYCNAIIISPQVNELGKGAHAVVYMAKHIETGEVVAVKEIDMNKLTKKDLILMELKMMQGLQHPNIVRYVDAYLDGIHLFLVIEYMDGGPLTDVVTETVMKESIIAMVCREVLKVLHYLHSMNVVYRNVKV